MSLAPPRLHSRRYPPRLCLVPATLAALPSTRAIPDRDVFYVVFPKRSIPSLATCSMSLDSIRERAGYSQTAGDTPATTVFQLMRSDVLAGDGVQFLNCLMRQLKASASNILSQVFH
jgi:hypothetical protein